jgi:hypothetical protein
MAQPVMPHRQMLEQPGVLRNAYHMSHPMSMSLNMSMHNHAVNMRYEPGVHLLVLVCVKSDCLAQRRISFLREHVYAVVYEMSVNYI